MSMLHWGVLGSLFLMLFNEGAGSSLCNERSTRKDRALRDCEDRRAGENGKVKTGCRGGRLNPVLICYEWKSTGRGERILSEWLDRCCFDIFTAS